MTQNIDHTNKPVLERMIEILADNEHKTWASWQKWVQEEVCRPSNTGLIIPKEKVDRWKRQYNTDYKDLTDEEKESDRLQVYETAQALLTLFNNMCDEAVIEFSKNKLVVGDFECEVHGKLKPYEITPSCDKCEANHD